MITKKPKVLNFIFDFGKNVDFGCPERKYIKRKRRINPIFNPLHNA